ncbi:DUF2269 family protein [Dactylosporangium sp. NPDC051541]|uniref:DUF2269 family protein n=1 Tax=Dactylosporangium sp. NPDC051541 TaxID=3363977 RepID=UPI00379C2DE7
MTGRRTRKTLLTLHVCASVGWLGGALTVIVLGIFATRDADPAVRHGVFVALHTADRFVMIPIALLAAVTGVVSALASPWGLARYRWVVAKQVLTVGAMVFGALYVSQQIKAALVAPAAELDALRVRATIGSGCMLAVLVVATALSTFKPWGRTSRLRRDRPDCV